MPEFDAVYRRSLDAPEDFWGEAANELHWDTPPARVSELRADGRCNWFGGGRLNTCFNALDRHVRAGHGRRTALIYDSPQTGRRARYSFSELLEQVSRLAGALRYRGVNRGDRVVIYMPMVPEAVQAMLACARLGAVHSVVFGGFAAAELAKRIDDAKPTLLITASCGIEPHRLIAYKPLVDAALSLARHEVPQVLVLQRDELRAELQSPRDLEWHAELDRAVAVDCEPVEAGDPLYILYTSGTTGIPKGVVRDNGGHATALVWSMRHVYGVQPGDVFWAASDIGWVVGHSYIVYAPLLYGCPTVLYEGKPVGTPDAGAFWRVVTEHDVRVLFTSPTALRAIKREDPDGRHLARIGTGSLKALFLAGERADPDTVRWAERHVGLPVIDHWWQTELGWPALASCVGLGERGIRYGSAGRPVPGYRFEVLNEAGDVEPVGTSGDLCIRLPLPPGCLATLWNNDAAFVSASLAPRPGYYLTGDSGCVDADGFVHVMGRVDDIINVAGHRLSSGGIEQVLAAHPDVAECAVVGVADPIKGMVPMGLVVLKAGPRREPAILITELMRSVREEIGAIAACRAILIVERLPKTRSGKILRATLRRMADGETVAVPPTIEDPEVLTQINAALRAAGYGQHEVPHVSTP